MQNIGKSWMYETKVIESKEKTPQRQQFRLLERHEKDVIQSMVFMIVSSNDHMFIRRPNFYLNLFFVEPLSFCTQPSSSSASFSYPATIFVCTMPNISSSISEPCVLCLL